jgi:hypothetical protein
MLEADAAETVVVQALKERLATLAVERSDLANRAQSLETELEVVRQAAQRCAAEAIRLEGLVSFYEAGQLEQTATTADHGEAPAGEEATQGRAQRTDDALPTLRRAVAQWTTGWRDEAVSVLRGRGSPMHYRELYRAISARGFTFGGKSPEATFLASLSRDRDAFVGTGRGCYWIVGDSPTSTAPAPGPQRRARKPTPIGRGR